MSDTDNLRKAIDKVSAQELQDPPRNHLGPSVIGRRCMREAWYAFRWAYHVKHTGRILRLFNRGHEEEFRVVRWLRMLPGVTVYDYRERLVAYCGADDADIYKTVPWDEDFGPWYEDCSDSPHHIQIAVEEHGVDLKQYGFEHGAHIAGSADGIVSGLEQWIPAAVGWGLFENKTHNEKSFRLLQTKGVLSSKPEHYNQVQMYMEKLGLPWCLYIGVNKNDDDIYPEIIPYRKEIAENYFDRGEKIVAQRTPPPRITEDASWFQCRMCDFREICHYDEPIKAKSCRSCAFASAETEGWRCNLYNRDIPGHFVPKGCDQWEPVD